MVNLILHSNTIYVAYGSITLDAISSSYSEALHRRIYFLINLFSHHAAFPSGTYSCASIVESSNSLLIMELKHDF